MVLVRTALHVPGRFFISTSLRRREMQTRSRCPEVGLGLLVLTLGVFVGNSTVQALLCVLRGFLNLLELPQQSTFPVSRGRGLYLDPKWPSYSPGLRPRRRARPKATPPPARRRLRQRCPEVGLGLLDGTRDRGKARGDVFGVLDFWAG